MEIDEVLGHKEPLKPRENEVVALTHFFLGHRGTSVMVRNTVQKADSIARSSHEHRHDPHDIVSVLHRQILPEAQFNFLPGGVELDNSFENHASLKTIFNLKIIFEVIIVHVHQHRSRDAVLLNSNTKKAFSRLINRRVQVLDPFFNVLLLPILCV